MRIALLAAAALALAGCSRRPALPVYGHVPPFVLTAETGEEFRSEDALKGRIWAADFIFTTCQGPCPRMTRQMRWVQEHTADLQSFRIVSFTVDPQNDTPPVLAAYAKRSQADTSRWRFLTGPQPALDHLGRDAFKLHNVDGSLVHSTRFVLVDGRGDIRGYYDTTEEDALKRLVADARALAGESP